MSSFENADCNNFDPNNNLFDTLSSGNSISINNSNGFETAEYTFSGYIFDLSKVDGNWVVDSVFLTR